MGTSSWASSRAVLPAAPFAMHRPAEHDPSAAEPSGAPASPVGERPARGEPAGLLILHHGRGADEQAALAWAEQLDPHGRLHVIAPRAPLALPGGRGHQWFAPRRIGRPAPRELG